MFMIDLIGWIGSSFLILGYALLMFNKISGDSLIFKFLNLIGSILLVILTFYKSAYQAAIVNCLIVVLTIISIFKNNVYNK